MATRFLRALCADDALALALVDLFIVHPKMDENWISFRSNVDIRHVRSKLHELEKAGWVGRSKESTWCLTCDKNRIVDKLNRMRQRVAPQSSDNMYLCATCKEKFSMIALIDQLQTNPEGFFCPTCNTLLVDDEPSTIESEIDRITKLLRDDDNVLAVT